jgi:hypothetical protein
MTSPPAVSPRREALLPRDELGPASRVVLESIPARGAGPAVIAVGAGLDVDSVVSTLGLLAAGGFVERCTRGWRIRRLPPGVMTDTVRGDTPGPPLARDSTSP